MNRKFNQSLAVAAAISRIASNNTSGAAEILRQAGATFTLLKASSSSCESLDQSIQAILETCTALASGQPDMTPLLHLASAALSGARSASDPNDSFERAETAALAFIANAERAARLAALHAVKLIRDGATILTHSRSSTVLAAFIEAKRAGLDFSVVATESRPMLEGRALAEAVAREGIPVTVIADAAASLQMERVNLVLMGADKITPLKLINKIGTHMIALAARERGLSLHAVCDGSKFISEDFFGSPIRRSGNAGELWPDAPGGVAVDNRYFESTSLQSFAGIVTEDGALSIDEAARRAEEASIDIGLAAALGSMRGN